MAEPAYAYRHGRAAEPRPDEASERRRRLVVLEEREPSRRALPRPRLQASTLVCLGLALLLLASAPFAHIWLVNERLRLLVEGEGLKGSIAALRFEGYQLESEYTALANPQGIQRQAAELGMAPDPDPQYLHINAAQASAQPAGEPDAPVPASLGLAAALSAPTAWGDGQPPAGPAWPGEAPRLDMPRPTARLQ